MNANLEMLFHGAMLDIYRRALSECGYNATRFLGMLTDHGGLQTARILIHSKNVSEGYTALWERNRLDLTVEAHVIKPEWAELFSEEEKIIARQRLIDYGYQI